jgi:hypothetical protein
MKYTGQVLIASILLTISLMGCSDREAGLRPASSSSSSAPAITDRWLGQWNGPEATFLRLAGGQGKYEITIQNLDGPRTFQGSAAGGEIQFERNGLKESIRATDGAGTGMKWLSDKSNCLTVRAGEGYCRD